MDLRSRNKINTGFSQSGMTDLVFLLLIFFIIISTLVSPYALPVDLPESSNKTKQKPVVSVTIEPDLTHYVNSRQVDPANIESILRQKLGQEGTEQSIVLHVDKTVPTGTMVTLLDIAKRNKWKIVLATQAQR